MLLAGPCLLKYCQTQYNRIAMPVTDRFALWWLRSNVGSYMGVELGGMSHTVLAFQSFFCLLCSKVGSRTSSIQCKRLSYSSTSRGTGGHEK